MSESFNSAYPMLDDSVPMHPILDGPHRWQLSEFAFRRDSRGLEESHIDITFERDGVVRRLRFYGPRELEINPEMLPNALGMFIADVSGRQLEGVQVRVGCFEHNYGCPVFWAARVVDLDHPDCPNQSHPSKPV